MQILTGEWSVNTGVAGTPKRLPGGEEELLIRLMTACASDQELFFLAGGMCCA